MALRQLTFDKASPSAPTLSGGASLGASGFSGPPIALLGGAAGSADGSFAALFGYGQVDSDSAGYLYVADPGNQRVQRFSWNGVAWVFDSKVLATAALGGAFNLSSVVVSNGEIHLAAYTQAVDNTWVGVWDVTQWPNLTVASRKRSYGSNAGASAAGKVVNAVALTVVGSLAVACSSGGDRRVVVWNHTTGALVAQLVPAGSATFYRFATDGVSAFGGGTLTSGSLPGVQTVDLATLAGGGRWDPAVADVVDRWGVLSNLSSNIYVSDAVYYNGRVYLREYLPGRLVAFRTSDHGWVDSHLSGGGQPDALALASLAGPFGVISGVPGGKLGIWVSPSSSDSDRFLYWASDQEGTGSESFLVSVPLGTATATWTYTTWSAGANALQSIALAGTYVSSDKVRVRLKKNSGAWVTIPWSKLADPATLATVGTFMTGDTLTVEVALSVWDRLGDNSALTAVRDHLPPTDISLSVRYDDPEAFDSTSLAPLAGVAQGETLRQRLIYVLSAATPQLAPEAPFVPLASDQFQDNAATTDTLRWRQFVVRIVPLGEGPNSSTGNQNNYRARFIIELGYPKEAFVRFDLSTADDSAHLYDREALKIYDFEQIDDLLRNLSPFAQLDADHLKIEGVDDFLLDDTFTPEDTGTVLRWAYICDYWRVRS